MLIYLWSSGVYENNPWTGEFNAEYWIIHAFCCNGFMRVGELKHNLACYSSTLNAQHYGVLSNTWMQRNDYFVVTIDLREELRSTSHYLVFSRAYVK